jgi:hypothetical protein
VTKAERATQIWSILTLAARQRQVLSYGLLGKAVGLVPHYLGDYLEPIQSFCLIHELPPLTVLVVQEASGVPGPGFSASRDIPRSQAEVFAKDWLNMRVPKPEDLAEAVEQLPSKDQYDTSQLAVVRRVWGA